MLQMKVATFKLAMKNNANPILSDSGAALKFEFCFFIGHISQRCNQQALSASFYLWTAGTKTLIVTK